MAVRLTLQGPEDIRDCFTDENPFKYGLKDTFFLKADYKWEENVGMKSHILEIQSCKYF